MDSSYFNHIYAHGSLKEANELRELIKKEPISKVRFRMGPYLAKYDQLDDILSNIGTISPQQIIDFILTKFTNEDNRFIFSFLIMFSLIRPRAINKISEVFFLLQKKRHCVFTMFDIYKENPIFLQHLIEKGCFKEYDDYETFVSLRIPLDYTPNTLEYVLKYDDIQSFSNMTCRANFTFKTLVTTNNFDFFMKEEEISMLSFCALYGSFKCFMFILNNNGRITLETCECAARGGNMNIIKRCKKSGGVFKTGLESAIKCHQKDAFDWLMENSKCEIPSVCVCAEAMNISGSFMMLLFSELVDIDAIDKFRHTALHYACKKSSFQIVELLLSKSASTEIRDALGRTALHYASKGFNTKIVEILVKSGANIDDKDNFGKTALHFASESGDFQTVCYLLENKASVDEKVDPVGKTPLHLAVENGHTDVVTFLLNYGANIEAKADFVGRREFMSSMTPFHFACLYDRYNTGYELFLRKANIRALNNCRMSALHLACKGNSIDFVKFLIDNGLDINKTDGNGLQPIHYAAQHCNKEITSYLLDHGANCNALTLQRKTCLHLCCETSIILPLVLDNASSEYRKLHSALNSKKIISNIESKIRNKIDGRVTNEQKQEYIKYLISLKCNVNAVDCNGQLPIHCACSANDIHSVASLISFGSKINVEDNNKMQPYNLTEDYKIKQYLVSKQNSTSCFIA